MTFKEVDIHFKEPVKDYNYKFSKVNVQRKWYLSLFPPGRTILLSNIAFTYTVSPTLYYVCNNEYLTFINIRCEISCMFISC